MSDPEFDFEDIRPYRDDEVREVLDRLSTDTEFLDAIVSLKLPRLKNFGFGLGLKLGRWLVGLRVRQIFSGLDTVHDFQQLMSDQLRAQMHTASAGITSRGLDTLNPDKAYLFISNHRDIAMDPAVVDLVLEDHGMDTVRIAIGDNLLTKPFASDLMRINKSFIVKRSSSGRREKLSALKQLSAYIRHSITEENSSIWIAQSEGRAKDGIDKTDTAMLKMLALSKAKGQSFAQAMGQRNIVPVSISYEFDPCDGGKARELHVLRTEGNYQKAQYEDLKSIYEGIVGYKGRIVVTFGEPLSAGFETADKLAAALDQQIISHYQLQATHLIAYAKLQGIELHPDNPETKALLEDLNAGLNGHLIVEDWAVKERRFEQRLAAIPEAEQDIFLAMYANPVEQYLRLQTLSLEGAGPTDEKENRLLRESLA